MEKKNGKGKEYLMDNILIYEGEYLNGKRNGKGKEYFSNGTLKFDGEYLNGKRWNGNGYDRNSIIAYELKNGNVCIKEYYNNNEIKYEAEYLNGEFNGKFKKYDLDNVLEFEGEYLNGKRNGKGKQYDYKGKLEFDGKYLYGHKRKGKLYLKKILIYEGEFSFDKKWNGKGYDENGNTIYELKNGKGKVKECDDDGIIFEGEFENGNRNGKGKEINKKGELLFEGEYLNGKRWNGKGKEYNWNNELIFEGQYLNGKKISSK